MLILWHLVELNATDIECKTAQLNGTFQHSRYEKVLGCGLSPMLMFLSN